LLLGLLTLGVEVFAANGLQLGPGAWKPNYAPIVFVSVGAQVIWSGLIAKTYCAATYFLTGDRWLAWYVRGFSLERFLVFSLMLVGAGALLEIALALQQFGVFPPEPALAVAGAFTIVVGMQSFFNSFVVYLLTSEYSRPEPERKTREATTSSNSRGAMPEPATHI
jgi:hypothetical protein